MGPAETASSRLNLSQTFNGMGCFLATFIVGQFLFRTDGSSGDVTIPYTVMGIVVLLAAVVFSFVQLPEISHDGETSVSGVQGISQLWRHKWFVFGLVSLLAYEVAEISINSYFVNYVTGNGWMDKNAASVMISLALVIFMGGRFLGSFIMRYVKDARLLLICAIGTVCCMMLAMINIGKWSVYVLMLNYLFEAIMFPTIFSMALRGLGPLTKSASSLLMMTPVGGCGFLLMGMLADETGSLSIPFIIPLIGYAVIVNYAYVYCKRKFRS